MHDRNLLVEPAISHLTHPSLIGKEWSVIRKIGSGCFGQVFLAEHRETGQRAAIKLFFSKTDIQVFYRELNSLIECEHPNIVPVLSYGYSDGLRYLVYEYCAGGSLRHLLNKKVRLTILHALSILSDVARALMYLHEKRFVHRDLKPENILLSHSKSPFSAKVCDFGHVLKGSLASQDSFYGSPGYIAPEQSTNNYDHQVDIYSLGVLLFEMVTGKQPFSMNDITLATFIEETHALYDFQDEFKRFLLNLTATDPERRMKNLQEIFPKIDDLKTSIALHQYKKKKPATISSAVSLDLLWKTSVSGIMKKCYGSIQKEITLLTNDCAYRIYNHSVHLLTTLPYEANWVQGTIRLGWAYEIDGLFYSSSIPLCETVIPENVHENKDILDYLYLPFQQALLVLQPRSIKMVAQNWKAIWKLNFPFSYGEFPTASSTHKGRRIWLSSGGPQTHLSCVDHEGTLLSQSFFHGDKICCLALEQEQILLGLTGQKKVFRLTAQGDVVQQVEFPDTIRSLHSFSKDFSIVLTQRKAYFFNNSPLEIRCEIPLEQSVWFSFDGKGSLFKIQQRKNKVSIAQYSLQGL